MRFECIESVSQNGMTHFDRGSTTVYTFSCDYGNETFYYIVYISIEKFLMMLNSRPNTVYFL